MNRIFYIFFLLFILFTKGIAQQDPQFTQYMYSDMLINPGVAGHAGICATAMFRQQWAGFSDRYTDPSGNIVETSTSPQEFLLTLHAPVRALHGGLGLSVYRDKYGNQSDVGVNLAYAFRMNLGNGNLGIGLAANLLSRSIIGEWRPNQEGDPVISSSDASDFYFDISFGVHYLVRDKWYVGVSGTQLIGGEGKNTHQRTTRHLYFYGGYTYIIPSNPYWSLKPSAMIKTDLSTAQYDVTLLTEWNETIWFGASYRIDRDAVALLVGAKPFASMKRSAARGLEVGFSYDISTSKLGYTHGRSFGGFEVMLKYCFNIVKTPGKYGTRNTIRLGNRGLRY